MKMMGRSLMGLVFLGCQLSILVGPTRTRASDWVDESTGETSVISGGNDQQLAYSGSGSVEVTALEINVLIEDHYARAEINADVRNTGASTASYQFSQVVPDGAYISRYEMTIDGKKYIGDTEEKKKAQERYDEAVSRGDNAGQIRQDEKVKNNFNI